MRNEAARPSQGGTSVRRLLAAGGVALAAVVVAGCTTHSESVQNPCSELSPRGAIALAKLGLTPDELKQQEKC
jgi:hypothetical protein